MKKVLDEMMNLMESASTQPIETGVPGLSMIKGDVPKHQLAALYKPMIGFTVQGTKILSIGERSTTLEGPSYHVLPVHVPATASVHPDRSGRPYMALGLELNQNVLQSLLRDLPEDLIPTGFEPFAACEIDLPFMETWLRLLRLMKTPRDIPGLAPAYEREILYRVLVGPQGWYLRQLGLSESNFSRIGQTVKWLRDNYMRSIDIGEIASKTGMAINTFHRQFKRATGLSPIQFQKQLRLQEARRLLITSTIDVAEAAYRVGYESTTQFIREYSRMFGFSPKKDLKRLKSMESE